MATGSIFDIERSSTVDGPGIRTVIFLKGCNFKCQWCHNPESIATQPQLLFDKKLCCHCGDCLDVCPNKAHQNINGEHVLNRSLCTTCFRCSEICPSLALRKAGVEYTSEQLLNEIISDKDYFDLSGGGVTFSGGEPMCQFSFLEECLNKFREKGISCAIETNLSIPFEKYEKILPLIGCLMLDIKSMNSEKHKAATGQSNQQVLNNYIRLCNERWAELPIIVRTPIIPTFNDTPEEIKQIAEFVKLCSHLKYYELLAYHPLGEDKRTKLGIEAKEYPIPQKEEIYELAKAAASILPSVKVNGTLFSQE